MPVHTPLPSNELLSGFVCGLYLLTHARYQPPDNLPPFHPHQSKLENSSGSLFLSLSIFFSFSFQTGKLSYMGSNSESLSVRESVGLGGCERLETTSLTAEMGFQRCRLLPGVYAFYAD